jgi:hypothetical protein
MQRRDLNAAAGSRGEANAAECELRQDVLEGELRIVSFKRVAARAGVDAHVHALRAAFAAYYLSLHPGDVEALKELLGHRSIATKQVYLRKFDKATAMERVRDLSWRDVAASVNGSEPGSSEIAAKTFESLAGVGAGGFEPP